MRVKVGCSNTSFRPQFVTELQHSDLDMLKLPSEFMMHVEDENKSRSFATVLSPIGKTWNIKLTRDRTETFLNEGWPEFSKFHKLEVGFKLVFRYEGNMVFNAKVFGLNGCLKDYNQDAVTILIRRSGFNSSRDKSPAKCASVTEASSSSGKQIKRKHNLVKKKERPHYNRSKMREDPRTTTNSYVKKIRNKTTISASHQTLKRRMNNCTIYKFMTLPKIFGSVPPYNLEKGEITLKNEKQEIWKVQFSSTATKYNSFCGGWKQFCVKNNIKCGDTCTLEIIAHNEILVSISKAANKTVETSDIKSDV